eukprot:scaffold4.g4841.t1
MPSTSGRDRVDVLDGARRQRAAPRHRSGGGGLRQGSGGAPSPVTFRHEGGDVKLAEQRQQEQQQERQQGAPPPPPPPPPSDEERRRRDFYANVGDAIRTLREDIPLLFHKDLNYDIYREDITFRDPSIAFHGLKSYRLIFRSLRFHGRVFCKALYVEVQRIWQPDDAQIKVRWKVYAKPRLGGPDGQLDGIFTYRLDRSGKIYEHSVDNVQLRDPPIRNPLLYWFNWILVPAPQAQQVPCPGSWCEGAAEEAALPALPASSGSWDDSWDAECEGA